MRPMSKEEAMRVTAEVMQDETPLTVTISIKEAWLLVSALQLACRHPGLSGFMHRALKKIALQFQQAITERHPEARVPFEMGWNPAFDVKESED